MTTEKQPITVMLTLSDSTYPKAEPKKIYNKIS